MDLDLQRIAFGDVVGVAGAAIVPRTGRHGRQQIDRDWTADNQRTGADAELKWQALELSANYYLPGDPFALSSRARPLPRSDVSVTSQLPFLPLARASVGASDLLAPRDGPARSMTRMQLRLLRNLPTHRARPAH